MSSYRFRILLDNSNNEEIFRDITVSQDATFSDFYDVIIEAFSFNGDQLASFYVSNNTWDKGDEISLMDMGDSILSMNSTFINDIIEDKNQKFILVYDFLKMWCFLIELVETDNDNIIDAPEITLSIGVSPDENSREIDLSDSLMDTDGGLGSELDDIFNEFGDEDDFGGFENIDDLDI